MDGIDGRLMDWVRSVDVVRRCDVKKCREIAHRTEVGNYCLEHYKKLPGCVVPGCTRPRAFRADKCRQHFIDEDPAVIAEHRDAIVSPSSSLGKCADDALGKVGSLMRGRRKTARKREAIG